MAYTLQDSYEAGAVNTPTWFANSYATGWPGFAFQASGSYTLTAVEVNLQKTGSLAGKTLTCYIYSATGTPTLPNAAIGTSTNTISADVFGTGALEWSEKFTFAGVSITSGTWYYVVLSISALGDASNYLRTGIGDTGLHQIAGSDDGSSWDTHNSNRGNLRSYSGTADVGGRTTKNTRTNMLGMFLGVKRPHRRGSVA